MNTRPAPFRAPARGSTTGAPEPLTASERDQLARHLLGLLDVAASPAMRGLEPVADVRALVDAVTADDARQVCEEIETRLCVRQLYDRFRSFHEASRRVSAHLRELDRDLVELARQSELFRPEACEDIALFHAALERAQTALAVPPSAPAAPGDALVAELAFIRYLAGVDTAR